MGSKVQGLLRDLRGSSRDRWDVPLELEPPVEGQGLWPAAVGRGCCGRARNTGVSRDTEVGSYRQGG